MKTGNILIVDDEDFVLRSLKRHLEKEGHKVLTANNGKDGILTFQKNNNIDIILQDVHLPDTNGIEVLETIKKLNKDVIVIMISADSDIETAINATKLGAYDFLEKPYNLKHLSVVIGKALETVQLKSEVNYLRQETHSKCNFENIIAESEPMKKVVELAMRVAKSDATTILILGESGTGKNLIARAIHYYSARALEKYVIVTCTALADTLIESELFGHVKGAFTDAKSLKQGLFEVADGGTIYLDEIGDIQPITQAKLLRVIEEKIFKRVGGTEDIKINVRIIAATNKNLEKAVQNDTFRRDLYYRLNVFPIYIPPLMSRKKDIIPLATHYIKIFNREVNKNITGISPKAKIILEQYPWPGNARELQNVIERICLLENTDIIHSNHIPLEIVERVAVLSPDTEFNEKYVGDLKQLENTKSLKPQVNMSGSDKKDDIFPNTKRTTHYSDNETNYSYSNHIKPLSPGENAKDYLIRGLINYILEFPEFTLKSVEMELIKKALMIVDGNQTKSSKLLGISRDSLRYKMHKYNL